jgi:uncharacterized membrane protein YdjX (TVP38/TMEM64 family)
VALVLLYTPAEFVMFPRAVLTMLGAIAFGPWLGFSYAFMGIFLASLATYFAGRLLPRGSVQRFAGARVERMTKVVRRHGVLAVLAVRLVPVAPSGMEGIIAGAIRIPLWHYLVGTMAGMTPGMLATTFFGHQISNALEDPSRVNYWLIGIVVVLLAGLIYVLTRRFALE